MFYQRLYEHYLPVSLRSAEVSKYTKCCYIPYGYVCVGDNLDVPYEPTFLENIYMFFADNLEGNEYVEKCFKISFHLGRRKVEYYGYPILDKTGKQYAPNSQFTVLWTPRWATDGELGGSHFFYYYKQIPKLSDRFDNLDVVIRPHPLAFDNYVKQGLMTKEEVSEYIFSYNKP